MKDLSYFLEVAQKFITFNYLFTCLKIEQKSKAKFRLNSKYLIIKNLNFVSINFEFLGCFFSVIGFQIILRVNSKDFVVINISFLI